MFSPISFLICWIYVFFFTFLIKMANGLSILFVVSKNQHFDSLMLYIVFLILVALIFPFMSVISSLFFNFGLGFFFFSRILRFNVKLFFWVQSVFLMCKFVLLIYLPGLRSLCSINSGMLYQCYHLIVDTV